MKDSIIYSIINLGILLSVERLEKITLLTIFIGLIIIIFSGIAWRRKNYFDETSLRIFASLNSVLGLIIAFFVSAS